MKSLSGTTSCHAGSSDQYCAIDIVSVVPLSSCGKIENFSLARNDLINMLIFGFRIFVNVDDAASIESFVCLVEIGLRLEKLFKDKINETESALMNASNSSFLLSALKSSFH